MEKLKNGGRQIAAGRCAGLVEACIMHPLDLVKIRLQIGGGHFTGLGDVLRKTVKNEGFLGFYKGILPPLLIETPKGATKFFAFEQYKQVFNIPSVPQWMSLSAAGFCSGLTDAVVICPSEVVKVRLQSEHNVAVKDQKSTMATAREIVRQKGLGTTGIYRGLGATMYRQAVWNMVYFGVYHNIKHLIPDAKENPGANLGLRLLLGFAAGTLASVANIPFDVAKSRIQGPQPATGRIYHTTWQTVLLVRRQEGFKTLYRGLAPKVMRLGPGGAIMLVVYETIYDFLKKNI